MTLPPEPNYPLTDCPFCGGMPSIISKTAHYARCRQCGARGPRGATEELATMLWNTRATPTEGKPT